MVPGRGSRAQSNRDQPATQRASSERAPLACSSGGGGSYWSRQEGNDGNMAEQGDIVLVTGATGNTGRAVLDAVLQRDVPVQAMVRAEADRGKLPDGVQAVIGDFDDPASVAAALAGAGRAYLVTPSSERAEEQQRRFADLAAKAGTRQLVVLSQLGADEHSPARFLRYHGAVEQHVRDLGIPYTFLRPNLYFQGLLPFARQIATDGRFYAPIGDARVSAVDVRDIGAVAAVTLTETGHEGAAYTLTGPAAITHAQIAEALTAALSRQVTFVDVSPSVFADSLRGVLPPWQVGGLVEDYANYRRGDATAVSSAIAEITSAPARDVAQFARDYAPVFSDLPGSPNLL
jgi:uncharacterized protein YbjT (DUF2867 family)